MNHARVLLIAKLTLNSFYIGGWKEKSAELVRADLRSSVFKIKTDERRDAGFQSAGSLLGLTPWIRDLGGMRNRESGGACKNFLEQCWRCSKTQLGQIKSTTDETSEVYRLRV